VVEIRYSEFMYYIEYPINYSVEFGYGTIIANESLKNCEDLIIEISKVIKDFFIEQKIYGIWYVNIDEYFDVLVYEYRMLHGYIYRNELSELLYDRLHDLLNDLREKMIIEKI